MRARKQQHHEAIRERARRALASMYHNATPTYPDTASDEEARESWAWFDGESTFEVEYINDGGAYGRNYRKTLEAPCNGGKCASPRAREYYVRWKLRERDEDRAKGGAWERITEYGKVYGWGRGGRTLAPHDLIRQGGGSSFSIREDYADGMPIGRAVDLLRVVESFNAYVEGWCKAVPEMWAEEKAAREAERREEEGERAEWAARDVVTA